MLAYVFWHSRTPSVARSEYEGALKVFHARLAEHRPVGYLSSDVFHVQNIPWLGGLEGYEDWYLMENSAAIDALDSGSVSGEREEPHHAVARLAARGTAGLYKPVGSPSLSMSSPS